MMFLVVAAMSLQFSELWSGMLQRPSLFLLIMAAGMFFSSWVVQVVVRHKQKRAEDKRSRLPLVKGELS